LLSTCKVYGEDEQSIYQSTTDIRNFDHQGDY